MFSGMCFAIFEVVMTKLWVATMHNNKDP